MKKIIIAFILLPHLILSSQGRTNNTNLSEDQKKDLIETVKDLYITNININFNISAKDLSSSFKDIPDEKQYNETYLNNLLEKFKNDTLNPISLNNIAEYYSKKENFELANTYYTKALQNFDIKYFNNDKALFYSTRAVIKINLGDTTANKDFRASLKINPNDSISKYFYPLVLISNGKHDEIKKISTKQLDAHVDDAYIPYLYLATSEAFKSIQLILSKENTDYKKEYANKNYDEIINYALLNKYATKYKGNTEIQNCRILADLLGLIYKIIFFETDKNYKFILNYSNYEKNKIKDIIKDLKRLEKQKNLNEHTVNKSLGYAYFMLEEWDKSINYFNKAIDNFPTKKQNFYFTPIECYDAIITMNYHRNDTLNFRKKLIAKMATQNGQKNIIDEFTLAIDYFKNDDIVQAEKSCVKIRSIDSNNFDALRLLSHINFIKGASALTEYYGEMAGANARNDEDNYNLITQLTIYQIYYGNYNLANPNIEILQQIKGKDNCPMCDKLMKMTKK